MIMVVDCRYYSDDICKVISQPVDRGNDCKNPINNACCYTCEQRNTCTNGCDFLYSKSDEEAPQLLSEEEQLKAGQMVLRNMCVLMGILLCITGGIFLPFFGNVGILWRLFLNIPSWRTLLLALCGSTPIMLLLLGGLFIAFGAIKVERKTTEERKFATMTTTDQHEQEKPKEHSKKKECRSCVYYLEENCPRGYSHDNELWRTQKPCNIFTFKGSIDLVRD